MEWLVGVIFVIGLCGIVVPVLPGVLLIWGGLLLWATQTDVGPRWWIFGIATAILIAGTVVKYLVPGRRMQRSGVRTSTLLLGVLIGVVGAFVIPVLGFFLGFPLGIYLVERVRRGGHPQAWFATKEAIRGVLSSIGIELVTALAAIAVWAIAVFFL